MKRTVQMLLLVLAISLTACLPRQTKAPAAPIPTATPKSPIIQGIAPNETIEGYTYLGFLPFGSSVMFDTYTVTPLVGKDGLPYLIYQVGHGLPKVDKLTNSSHSYNDLFFKFEGGHVSVYSRSSVVGEGTYTQPKIPLCFGEYNGEVYNLPDAQSSIGYGDQYTIRCQSDGNVTIDFVDPNQQDLVWPER